MALFDGVNIWSQGPGTAYIAARSYSWYWNYQTGQAEDQCFFVPWDWQALVAEPILLDAASHGPGGKVLETIRLFGDD
jgi:hypothetical protein